jgi:hypothetical protein
VTSEFSYLNLLLTDFKFENSVIFTVFFQPVHWAVHWEFISLLLSEKLLSCFLIIIFLINVINWVKTICRTQIPISNGVWRKTEAEQLIEQEEISGKWSVLGLFSYQKKNNKVTKIIKDYLNQNWKNTHFSITAIFYLSYDSTKKLLHFFHKNLWVFLRLFFPKRNILSLLFSALTSLESRSFLSFL